MIKPWLFEFLPELGGPGVEPDPPDVAALFARYLDLWEVIKRIFDAYREEADAAGFHTSPDDLALRRRDRGTSDQARLYAQAVTDRLKSFVAEDERLNANVPDAPAPSGGFTLSGDEFITGTPRDVAHDIIEQCRAVGAGNFLTVLNWSAPVDEVAQAHELFGREAVPLLRAAS